MNDKKDNENISNIFSLFKGYCRPGVYAIINDTDRKIFISHSTNILSSAARVITLSAAGTHPIKDLALDIEKLEFKVLEIEEFANARLVKVQRYINKYKSLGYKIYNKSNHAPKFKVRMYITNDFECWVAVVNSRYKKFLVKQFKTVSDAEKYIQLTPEQDIIQLYIDTKKSTRLL